jgi:hypothetical protein
MTNKLNKELIEVLKIYADSKNWDTKPCSCLKRFKYMWNGPANGPELAQELLKKIKE